MTDPTSFPITYSCNVPQTQRIKRIVMGRTKSALLLLAFCHLHAIALADCFWFNGLSRNDTNYAPCYLSSCCRGSDTCRTDGLCVGGNGTLWRESCSDSNWNDPSCPKLCVDGTGRLAALASYLKMMRTKTLTHGADQSGQLRNSSDQLVTQCPDTSFCCGQGDNATTCCNEGKGQFILSNGTVSDKKPSSAGVVTTVTQGSGPTDTTHPKSTANASSSNTGAIAGGAVGGVAVVAFVACGTWLFLRKRTSEKLRRQLLTSVTSEKQVEELPAEGGTSTREELDSIAWNEAAGPATEAPVELCGRQWIEADSGPQSPQEMDGAPLRR